MPLAGTDRGPRCERQAPQPARIAMRDGRKLAVAVIHRDLEGLNAEVEFERIERPGPSSADREIEELV